MRFGVHVSIAGGLPRAVERAAALGCDAFQIFCGNPRGWAPRPLPESEARAFRAARSTSGLGPVVVHLTYLPNPASPDRSLQRKSARRFREEYAHAARLGADLFVLHPGSATTGRRDAAIRRAGRSLRAGLEAVREGPRLLLETMAGGGAQLGGTPEELAALDAAIGMPGRTGVCLDTAHVFAAGYDIAAPGGMARLRRAFRAAYGRHPVRLLHANDLRGERGCRHDRHDHVGLGAIGAEGFRRIFHTPGLRRVPVICETPVDDRGDDEANLARARALSRKK